MKKTRCAFYITGSSEDLSFVISDIKDFKAVSFVDHVTEKALQEVFSMNKSVLCTDPNISNIMEAVHITVNGNDSTNGQNNLTTNIDTFSKDKSVREQFQQIADAYNIDIGDHRSNSTKEGPSQNPADCVFCRYIAGHPDLYQPTIYESENFILMPNSGHFVLGSLLIVPKQHIMSCAELSDEVLNELLEVIEDAKYILTGIYKKPVLVWENGSGKGGHGKDKSSIVHAHVHMNPSDMDILNVSLSKGIELRPINYLDLKNYQEESYLLVENYDLKWYIVSNPNLYIPRQYVRQLVAEDVKLPGDLWNWRKYLFEDNVVKTTYDIKQFLHDNKDTLPERILSRTSNFTP